MKYHLKSFVLIAALGVALTIQPASAQWAVYDHANFIQNTLQAVRALKEIDNQVESLQHEITMIQTMERNLESLATSPLGSITSDLDQVKSLMTGGPGIPFLVGDSQAAFSALWPQSYPTTVTTASLESDAQGRWQKAMAAFEQTLSVQSQIAQNVLGDTATLSQVLTASQGASGNLDAVQAGNQLLALSTKQQLQTQSLMAAQYRADALQQANQAEGEEEGRAQFTNFLGSDSAYTP